MDILFIVATIVLLLALAGGLYLFVTSQRRAEERNAALTGPIRNAPPTGPSGPEYLGPDDEQPAQSNELTDDSGSADDSPSEDDESDEESEPEKEYSITECIAEGDSCYAAGEWSDAVSWYDDALSKIRNEKGNLALDLIPVLVKRIDAQTAEEGGDWDETTNPSELLLALSISEFHNGVFSELNRPLILALIAFYDRFNVPDKADCLIRRLEQLTASAAFTTAPVQFEAGTDWQEEANKGVAAYAEHQYDTATDHYDNAFHAAEPKVGAYGLALAPILLQCGVAYQARDYETDDSETTPSDYLWALGVLERNVGPQDPTLVTVLTYIVSFYDQVGEHYRADRYLARLRQALPKS